MATTSSTDTRPVKAAPGRESPAATSWPRRAIRHIRTPRRPLFISELVLVALSYGVYSLIRNAVPEQQADALRRAMALWRFEQTIHLDFELWLNHTVHAISWLTVGMNYFYATMHFVVTLAVLTWLYWRHPGRYRAARTVLAITTGLALFGYFFYALAPPRLLPNGLFFDTVALHQTWGSMASGDLQSLSNQYAAMPSMHAGWSMWCGIAIFMFAKRRWVRVLGTLYPMLTVLVITATANHFVVDAVGGWLTLSAGFVVQWLIHGRPVYGFNQHVVAVT